MSIFKSIKGLFGQTIHYENGVKVGETWDGLVPGTKTHYNQFGEQIGYSTSAIIADEIHYDRNGSKIGESWDGTFGETYHYGEDGTRGVSYDTFMSKTTRFDSIITPDDPHDSVSDSSDNSDAFESDSFGNPYW